MSVSEGKVYTLQTVKKALVQLVFVHKDEEGQLQDGVTAEDLIAILIHRYRCFVDKTDSAENHQVLTFLIQAKVAMDSRRRKKYMRKHNKEK
jgi:hypothetical protein